MPTVLSDTWSAGFKWDDDKQYGYLFGYYDSENKFQRIHATTLSEGDALLPEDAKNIQVLSFQQVFSYTEPMNCLTYIRPEIFNVFITDVLSYKLKWIEDELRELKLNYDENTYPIVSHGTYSRLFVCLPIKNTFVVFLLGLSLCPYTYIAKNICEGQDIEHQVHFRGSNMLVYPSSGYFADLSILGGNWLDRVVITFDYKTHEGFLTFK